MSVLNSIALLATTYLVVYLQATLNDLRHVAGTQIDLLPSLVVYTSLCGGLTVLTLVAVCGGLWFDSLSANPLGVTVLPLFVAGLLMQRARDFLLRDQLYAQMLLGLAASAAVPAMTLLLLLNLGRSPLVGWFSLWQWLVVAVAGAVATPFWFRCFDWISGTLSYQPVGEGGYRPDREIKRGRQ